MSNVCGFCDYPRNNYWNHGLQPGWAKKETGTLASRLYIEHLKPGHSSIRKGTEWMESNYKEDITSIVNVINYYN